MAPPKIQFTIEPYRVDLIKPFRISRDSYDHKLGMRVILTAGDHVAVGETQEHVYYGVKQGALKQQLMELKAIVEKEDLLHPADMYQIMQSAIGWQPFSLAAVDMAYWDLYAKTLGKTTRSCLDLPRPETRSMYTSYTISIDSMSAMIRESRMHPYKILKVKLGTKNDLPIMEGLFSASEADFYVDANCGWDLETAREFARHFEDSRLMMIEQPLPADAWQEMKSLRKMTDIPLIADESFTHFSGLEQCATCFDGINIKLLKCGGLTPAQEIIQMAGKMGLDVMVGCMMESAIGISAALQIVPWATYVDIDSFMFIREAPAVGVQVASDGQVILPERPGNGYRFLLDL